MSSKPPSFEQLKKHWYKKLKSAGFEDIEQDENRLKSWSSHYFGRRHHKDRFEAQEEYFRLAGQFLYTHEFDSRIDKAIWTLHAEGHTTAAIYTILRAKKIKVGRDAVYSTVKKLTKLMVDECLSTNSY